MKHDFVTGRRSEIPMEDEETSLFMYVLTSIYIFLFDIVLAMVLAINSMADSWEKDISGSLTVQIIPIEDKDNQIDKEKTEEQQNKVLQFMENVSGVENVKVIGEQQVEKLMTPWLGKDVDIASLPIPTLLDVKLKSDADINYDEITRGLLQITSNASIDNHRLWLNRLLKFADSLKLIALAVLLMVVGICAFSIYYSTRASLGININTITLLHIVGAKDEYIAKQYATNYARIGLFSGIIGLTIAGFCIYILHKFGITDGNGLISGAELSGADLVLILLTPIFSLFYAMSTSYLTVRKSLEQMM